MLLDNDFRSDNRVEKEAVALIKAGYSVEVVCLRGAGLPDNEQRRSIQITRCIDPLIYTRPFSAEAARSGRALIEMLRAKDFDFLHCHDYNLVHVGSRLGEVRRGLAFVYDSHEYFAQFQFYRNAKGLWTRLKTWLVWRLLLLRETRAARHYDALITTTDYIGERLSNRFRIRNWTGLRNIPERQAVSGSDYVRQRFSLGSEAVIVVHTGNIYFGPEYVARIHQSLEALGRSAYFVFFVDPDRSRRHRAFVSEHGLEDRILFLDYPARDELIQHLSSATIGFSWVNTTFGSQVYSSPNRYWEYTMAQLPVVSNQQWEIAEQLRKHGNGVLFADEDGGLVAALQEVLRNYRDYKQGAIKASLGHSWEVESEKLVRLYEGLAAQTAGTAAGGAL